MRLGWQIRERRESGVVGCAASGCTVSAIKAYPKFFSKKEGGAGDNLSPQNKKGENSINTVTLTC
jgi:hypothetical protein